MPANTVSGFSRTEPWHHEWEAEGRDLSVKEAIVKAGMDWGTTLLDVYAARPEFAVRLDALRQAIEFGSLEGKDVRVHLVALLDDLDQSKIAMPHDKATARDDTWEILGLVSDRYNTYSNAELFGFLQALVDSGEVMISSAGVLQPPGKLVWISGRLPKDVKVGEDDIKPFVLLHAGHSGNRAVGADLTFVDVVCENTLQMGIQGALTSWRAVHTDSMEGRVNEAREQLQLTFAATDTWEAEMNKLAETEFTKAAFEKLVKDVFPDQRAAAKGQLGEDQYGMIGLLEASPNITDSTRYTKWGAIQAVTEFSQWTKQRRVKSESNEARARLERIMGGVERKVAQQTYDYLVSA